jgi:hypothetical protein
MSGVDVVPGGSKRPRRKLLVPEPTATDTIQYSDQSLLASLSARHRITKSGLQFNKLTIGERKKI